MSHQPFETWILDNEELSDEQLQALEEHLSDCVQCNELEQNWNEAINFLSTAPTMVPEPGFVRRWESEFVERKAREHKMMTRRLLLFLAVSAVLTMTLLSIVSLATSSPIDFLAKCFSIFTSSLARINQIESVMAAAWRSLPRVFTVSFWILITSSMSMLSTVWAVSMWRIAFKGAKTI
jgi:hypothetical protein